MTHRRLCAVLGALLLALLPAAPPAAAEDRAVLADRVLTATGLEREHEALLAALSAGIEQALYSLEEEGEAIDPVLGARLLGTVLGTLDARSRAPELARAVAERVDEADLRALELWWRSELGLRIAEAEREAPGFGRGPPLPETRARLRGTEGFQQRIDGLLAASGAVELAVARRQAQMKAAALLRFVATEGSNRFDFRTLDRAARAMAPRLRREVLDGLPEATADVYRAFDLEELDAYLNHLRSPPFRALVEACLAHFETVEARTLRAMRAELDAL